MAYSSPTRRGLLAGVGLSALPVALAARSRTRRKATPPAPPPPAPPLVVNALGGLGDPNLTRGPAGLGGRGGSDVDARSLADARASGLTAVNVTLGYVAGGADPFEDTVADIGAWDRLLRDHPHDLLKVDRAADLPFAQAQGKIGVIYGFQNTVQIGDKLDRLQTFSDLGVRVIQLTYNPANAVGDGCMAPKNRGLTTFGRNVIETLNALKLMVDLSHSGEQTCLEAIAISTRPVSINHTGCRALADLPRNKSDAELRGVADKGGFIGIYFMPFLTLSGHPKAEDVLAHIDYAVNLCGEDHVGIGTDGDVTTIDDLAAFQARLEEEIEARARAGIAAKGERADTYPFVIDLRGPDQFRRLASLMRAKGYSTARIEKILGQNFLAYAREAWGG